MQMWIKILLIILIAAGSVFAFDEENVVIGPVVSGAAYTCASGTYMSFYDGDYDSDTDKICHTSGAGSKDGTNSGSGGYGAYGDGGNGWRYTTDDDNASYAVAADDLANDAEGTLWVKFKCASTPTGTLTIFEMQAGTDPSDNNAKLHIETTTAEVKGTYEGNTTSEQVVTPGSVTCDGSTWNTVGYAWKQGESGSDHAVTIGNTWATGTDEDDDDLTAWSYGVASIMMGNDIYFGKTVTVDFDRFVILSTYKASCPW